ncbi:ral guanine nucleotide dissociation stimulator-like [Dipodomys merriami]|uniref:ral guanine nucleotide dissociation stimulator-like n=1 Tax=Dipodomys merriami TaxID=94247 RepID=UPI003855F99E
MSAEVGQASPPAPHHALSKVRLLLSFYNLLTWLEEKGPVFKETDIEGSISNLDPWRMYQMEVSARTGSRKKSNLCRSSGARSLEGTGCRKEAHPALPGAGRGGAEVLLLGAVGEEAQLEWVLAPTLPDPYKAGYLQGGKVEKLVDHLVPALLFGDAMFIPVFLGTYRNFTTAYHVLNLLFNRYNHFLEYEEEKAGTQEHLQQAFFILGSWMREYPEDFTGAPYTSCLQHLVTYLHLNMPGSVEEQQARLLLSQLEHMLLKKPELEAVPPTARLYEKTTVQPLDPTPCIEAVLPCQSELELAVASEAPLLQELQWSSNKNPM